MGIDTGAGCLEIVRFDFFPLRVEGDQKQPAIPG
jgi:hypothetical protein